MSSLPENAHFSKNLPQRPCYGDFASGRERIAVVGLGYVGLPLAVAFAKKFAVVGYDISIERVAELRKNVDRTREVSSDKLLSVHPDSRSRVGLEFTTNPSEIRSCRLIIVTVPTPIDEHKTPDLTPLIRSSTVIGQNLAAGTTIVYESTVYPGCTEEECVPIIERESQKKWHRDFFVGYSPERINPGDKEHTVEQIKKVVSGDDLETAELLRSIYGAVITAGVFVASSIRVAEAAKVIENTQRDLNIALMNELAIIFNRLGIRTLDVLEAAGTKWNFLPFRPGLVGGHCIGVDPYYLTHKAESLGYHPQVILAGRRINDQMAKFVAERTVKLLIESDSQVKNARVLLLGITFKENVPDIRNTKVIDILAELRSYGVNVTVSDPEADPDEVFHEYGVRLTNDAQLTPPFDAVVIAVPHRTILSQYTPNRLSEICSPKHPIIVDIKSVLNQKDASARGLIVWQL